MPPALSCSTKGVTVATRARTLVCRGLRENVAQLPPQKPKIFRVEVPALNVVVEDIEGSKASLAIYAYLAQRFGRMNRAAAEEGLALYGEYVVEAKTVPGSHPRIEALLQVVAEGLDVPINVQTA